MTILAAENLPLIFRPYTPIIYRVLVHGAIPLPEESHADRPGGGGTRTGVLVGNGEDGGSELYEEEKESGG